MQGTEIILRVEQLSKRYGSFEAVRGVSFSVARGETVGFLGPNGAGKSTTIKMLCNLVRPTTGQVWLDGQPIIGVKGVGHRRSLGAVVEAPRFYPQLSGRRNLALLGRLRKLPPQRCEEMLERVGLSERGHVRFEQFSMGMKQRLGLAAAFLHEPALIILDEPTTGLDPVGQRRMHDLIAALAKERGVGVLLSSHQLSEVCTLCDRALVMHRGAVIHEQPVDGAAHRETLEALFAKLAAEAEQGAAP